MAEEHKTDYHAGLVAALKTKYDDQYDFMETIKEMILGEKPPRLDAVVLKKDPEQHLADEIGCFFLEHNVFEFKGYGDGISINDVYKIEGYALFYMTIDRKVNEIPLEAVTITVLQYRFPRDILKKLETKGCTVKQRGEGIFEIAGGPIIFPFQIIDAVILGEEWDVLKVLVPGATEEQIIKIQEEYDQAENDLLKQHLADVLKTAYESNEALFEKMKEEGRMGEKFDQIFEKQIQEVADKEKEKTIENMLKDNVKAASITKWTGASLEKIAEVATRLGMSTITL